MPEGNSFTVFRRQVIQTGDYEPAEASCSVTITVTDGATQEEIVKQIEEWGPTLDMANYEALGVGYEVTEQGVRRLSKSVPSNNASDPVAKPAARPQRSGGVGSKESYWDGLMNNQGDWWNPNWEKKLDGTFNNLKGPDYKHKKDNNKALWLSNQDGSSQVPDHFVCPFTGKDSDELGKIGKQIRARL